MASEDALATFMALTQAAPDVAVRALEIANGDVSTAVALYLDDPDMFAVSVLQEAIDVERSRATTAAPARGRRDDAYDDDGVRAPIPQRREVLMAPGPAVPMAYAGVPFIAQQAVRRQFGEGDGGGLFGAPGAGFGAHSFVYDDGEREESPSWAERSKVSRLQELFKPPAAIMFRGSLEDAKQAAGKQRKWLMVNPRKHGEFACETQNRDLWSDLDVQAFVKQHFIFMQLHSETDEGSRFVRLYKPEKYPFIAIIDPQTGELVNSYDHPLTPAEFLTYVNDWLGAHSLNQPGLHSRAAPAHGGKRPATREAEQVSPDGSLMSFADRAMRSFEDMTEDEQLKAALAASMEQAPPPPKKQNSVPAASFSPAPAPAPAPALAPTPAPATVPVAPALRLVPLARPAVNPKDPAATRLQVRLPDGSKQVFGFLKTDQVTVVYQHLKAAVPALANADFELMLHTDKTSDKLELSIEEARMANASLNVVVA